MPGITLWELEHFYKKEELLDLARTLGVRSSYPKINHLQKAIWKKVNEKSKDLHSLKGRPHDVVKGLLEYCGRKYVKSKQCQCGKCDGRCGPNGYGGCQCPECAANPVALRTGVNVEDQRHVEERDGKRERSEDTGEEEVPMSFSGVSITTKSGVEDVVRFLAYLGLSKVDFAAVVRTEHLVGAVLLEMTEDDLKQVGFTAFGDRKLILRALPL